MRIKAYSRGNAPRAKQERGRKEGTHDQRTRASTPGAPAPQKPAPVGTTTAPKREPQREAIQPPKVKYIFVFAPCGLRFSRENTKASKKKFTFAPFCPDCSKICHDGRQPDSGASGRQEAKCRIFGGHTKRDTPPICGATRVFSPHNFSHQKYRKKSPWQD